MIIWLTGLPCSGKSTIAEALRQEIEGTMAPLVVGRICEVLDGDDLRGSAFADGAGFTAQQRRQHLRRAGYLAQRLHQYVAYVICAFVSPAEAVRQELPIDLLVYVKCPLPICEARDVKGLWRKARAGEVEMFTGVSAPYEPPKSPDVVVETDTTSIWNCVQKILEAIRGHQ